MQPLVVEVKGHQQSTSCGILRASPDSRCWCFRTRPRKVACIILTAIALAALGVVFWIIAKVVALKRYSDSMCPGAAPGQPDRCAGPGTGTSVIASYYPPAHGSGPWATLKPEVAGYRSDGLRAAAQYAASQGNSRSFLLLKDGMIIWESCWGDSSTSIETPTFWASAQKSFTASATLAAASQGKLSLSSTVASFLGSNWAPGDVPSSVQTSITVQQLLSMSSSLKNGYKNAWNSYSSDAAGPGNTWVYSSIYGYLQNVLARATQNTDSNDGAMKAMQSLLFSSMGMSTKMYIDDPPDLLKSPPFAMKSLWKNFWALPRDGARLGLLFARNGMWNSEQLVQPQLIASAVSSSTPFNLAYGYLWWLNGKASGLRPGGKAYSGPFLPNCPSDAYAAVGANGQYVAVIPSLSIVLVRNGCPGSNADDSSNEADDALTPQGVLEELCKRLLAAKL